MRSAIIGAGNIRATLARKFRAAGHEVRLANLRGPESEWVAAQVGRPVIKALRTDDLLRALSAADKDRAPRKRDLALRKLGEAASPITNADVVRLNRSLF